MHNSRQTNYNEIKREIERFELMEKGQKSFFFDVHTIEDIFDFYTDGLQYEKAEKIIEIGIHQHPNATSLQLKHAIVLMEKGEDEKAVTLLQYLSQLEKYNHEVYLNLGLIYLRNNNIPQAEKNFRQALEVASEEREMVLFDIAVLLNQHEAYTQTIELLQSACNEFKTNEHLLFELAYAYDKENNLISGMEIYEKVIDINPFSENAWYNLGILHAKSSSFEQAIECYDFTLAITPEHSEALFNKANALVALQKFDEAIDNYFEYISFQNEPILPYHYIADSFEQLEKIDESLKYYQLLTSKQPDYMPAWLNYLAILINKEMVQEALTVSKNALKYHANFSEIWYLRARSLLLNNDLSNAHNAFEKAFEDDPDSLKNSYELYQLKLALKPELNGKSILDEWHQLYPTSPAVHYMLCAHYLLDERNITTACHHLTMALNEDLNIELFIAFYPQVEKIIKKSKKLSRIIEKHFDYEL